MQYALIILAFSALSGLAHAAKLEISKVALADGATTVQAEIRFTPENGQIAALQTDLVIDPALVVGVQIGDAASSSGKDLSLADIGTGRIRIVLAGFNQDSVIDGVVIILNITVGPDASSGIAPLRLVNTVASDPAGDGVSLATEDGSIAIPVQPPAVTPLRNANVTQVAMGDSWRTSILVTNPGGTPLTVRISYYSDAGDEWILPLRVQGEADDVIASYLERVIDPFGRLILETATPVGAAGQSGWARLEGTADFTGYSILHQTDAGKEIDLAVPLDAGGSIQRTLRFDSAGGSAAGFALANPTGQPVSVVAVVRNGEGNLISEAVIDLAPRGHFRFEVSDRFPAARQRRGSIQFLATPSDVSVLGIQFTPFGSFTLIPVI